MITYLKGELVIKDPTFLVIEVAGIGYEVKISLNTFGHLKDATSTKLHTHLHIKEDAISNFSPNKTIRRDIRKQKCQNIMLNYLLFSVRTDQYGK